ncbi:MAG: hypothetical protein A2339_00380 [Elusimicrobia bacterium RIFOXYB12_FULL_50_12]|nr:MAG: hypothetical protein A2278_05930 [Elusimicrobia bacterium RIFOXYA12_FULL_49_49]OGS11316.1 MAG: hypothetical protein A2386_08350 [Elusimicrobia bacterium RIFOXYB1_FULL_48_9]OGS16667.1 MAG: hypothetical protein A2251_04805 [Elusimicrobia bacterium RIFOXYA2_FULL_47_53]OGS25516.1 MAG: hypothetical protein A2339_00380 [Elusimicrobia bacterium RIFOXYB12_FULL_50_12]OGS31645.1 MAG: hypothetical protein A2323_03525 [Elusimicrobia bacterium RIFOXYB2_FULL_46_23]
MKIISDEIRLEELKQIASGLFGNMLKAVVDVKHELIAVDAELHSDLEAFLLKEGSLQEDVWGINIYPELPGVDFVEFDSLINIRPSQGNKIRGIEDERIKLKILGIVSKRIVK